MMTAVTAVISDNDIPIATTIAITSRQHNTLRVSFGLLAYNFDKNQTMLTIFDRNVAKT